MELEPPGNMVARTWRDREFSRVLVLVYISRARHLRYGLVLGDLRRGQGFMGRIIASLVIATALLSLATSEASAWVCRAAGVGSGGWARSYSIIDAKLIALRRCEHHSAVPICTILWCRPGY